MQKYSDTSHACSRVITRSYSTSFSMGILLLHANIRPAIYAIYGFVRLADEIVDTFHDYDKETLLKRFRAQTWEAIEEGISLNPVLHCFQQVVNRHEIDHTMITAFLDSMERDLTQVSYAPQAYEEYIYGSAEVVGLMCLKVFCHTDPNLYETLKAPARRLGAAFQKVNFLRDIQADYTERGRVYFPGVEWGQFNPHLKLKIEEEIREDFQEGMAGIRKLPNGARFGVYLAYTYYQKLFAKIVRVPAAQIMRKRIRVANHRKFTLLAGSYLKSTFAS